MTKSYDPSQIAIPDLVKTFVQNATGQFHIRDICQWYELTTLAERDTVAAVLRDMRIEEKVTVVGDRHGFYRRMDTEIECMDLDGDDGPPLDLWFPFHCQEIIKPFYKNVYVFAGHKDAGKTSVAFEILWAARDTKSFDVVRCLTSELGRPELKDRLLIFPGRTIDEWKKIQWVDCSSNYADKIAPNGLNVIDFLQAPEDAWKVKHMITEIWDRLKNGVAILMMQLTPPKETPEGGWGSLQKARLAVYLKSKKKAVNDLERPGEKKWDFERTAELKVAKNRTGRIISPIGQICGYDIVPSGGCIVPDEAPYKMTWGWHEPPISEEDEEAPKKKKEPFASFKEKPIKGRDVFHDREFVHEKDNGEIVYR